MPMLQQFTQSFNHGLTLVEASVGFSGGAGATTGLQGSGITSITKVATGTYQATFQNAWVRYLGAWFEFSSQGTGSTAATALVAGNVYTITALGTTTQAQWIAAGVPLGVTAAPGVTFVATGATLGTGTASSPANSGIGDVEAVGDPNTTLINSTTPYLIFQTLGATSTSVTTAIPAAPPNGCRLFMKVWLRQSNVKGLGE